MTYHLFLYETATWILPDATVEFREVLDEAGRGIRSDACPSRFLNSNSVKLWGTVIGDKAHLLIATGKFGICISNHHCFLIATGIE